MISFNKLTSILITFVILSSITVTSCGGNKVNIKDRSHLVYSQITKKVCSADTSQSYEVYLPNGYTDQQKWPVIYVFDPHGDGKFAVEHFKYAAEKYGYMVLGSNNSKNGLQTLEHTLEVLINDAPKSYSIDPNRQYSGGFSGGGRVAVMMATKYNNKGIITCGAGMSGFDPQSAPSKFDIFAIAGREDFNYDEVMAIQQQFANTDWRYITAAFDGGHNWPSPYLLSKALLWFELNAMKDGLISKDKDLETQTLDSIKLSTDEYIKKGQFLKATDELKMGISFIDRLLGTKKLENKLNDLQSQDGYINEIQKVEQLKLMEQQLRNEYMQGFNTQNLDWWNSELVTLSDKIKTSNDLFTRQMYSRIKGFLGIVCYSFTSKAIAESNIDLANKCVAIYQKVEPQNPDCFFYKAILLDKNNRSKEAVDTFKKAVSLGFKDMAKVKPSFSKKTILLLESSSIEKKH